LRGYGGASPIGFKLRNRTTSRGIAGSLSPRERVRVREDQGLGTFFTSLTPTLSLGEREKNRPLLISSLCHVVSEANS
jgi:hypothetical protein